MPSPPSSPAISRPRCSKLAAKDRNGPAWSPRALTTVAFLALSMAVATQVNSPTFKDIITVVIKWVAGLVGPDRHPVPLRHAADVPPVRADGGADAWAADCSPSG